MISNEIVHCLNALGTVAKEQRLFGLRTLGIKKFDPSNLFVLLLKYCSFDTIPCA
jgi:hypothetical protein